jgi:hypothetical protein
MAPPNPRPESASNSPPERRPFFIDEVDEFHELADHDTRGEPGFVPLPLTPIIPRVEKPAQSPDSSEHA